MRRTATDLLSPLLHHNEHGDPGHTGLQLDLPHLMAQQTGRRLAMRWLALAGANIGLAACGGGGSDAGDISTGSSGSSGPGTGSTGICTVIPEETQGPYPGDGSNSSGAGVANALALSGIVRSDMRTSVGTANGTAAGVPLTVRLQLVNTSASCANLAGYAIYLWHCDALGRYSMYSSGVTAENYLRGVQATGSDGVASFITIYPGCYAGRFPHMHFEIYRNLAAATTYTNKIKTSQLALPTAANTEVYASSGYTGSAANAAAVSLSSDGIFSDGSSSQLATVTGSVAAGYTANLVVGISA